MPGARRRARSSRLCRDEDYGDALAALAGLRPALDRYFDDVLVMAEDEAVRLNRLRQLRAVAETVRKVAHLDLLQG